MICAVISFICLSMMLCSVSAMANDTMVHGHYKHDGSYVHNYFRTPPNHTQTDNCTVKPKYNIHNGIKGSHTINLIQSMEYPTTKRRK